MLKMRGEIVLSAYFLLLSIITGNSMTEDEIEKYRCVVSKSIDHSISAPLV